MKTYHSAAAGRIFSGFAALALLGLTGCVLSGCSSTGTLGSFTPAQTAHIDYAIVTAALNSAAASASAPGLSVSTQADIKAAGMTLENAAETAIAGITSGQTITQTALSTAAATLSSALATLGTAMSAPQTKSNPEAALIAGGLAAAQQLAAVAGVVVAVQSGYQPTPDVLVSDLGAMRKAEVNLVIQ